nr:hypothetical protein [Armatimonadota bacterium]
MKTLFTTLLAVGVLGVGAFAATPTVKHTAMKKAPATLKCPSCGMPMPTKSSKATPVAVKVNGTTYY